MKRKNEFIEWIKAIVIAIIVVVLVRHLLFTNYVVQGKSMMPTIQDGNRLIVNKIDYSFTSPERQDMIVFKANGEEDYIKRVIGLPGDKIEYKNDQLYVNDKRTKEPYLQPYKQSLVEGHLTGDFTLEEVVPGHQTVPEGKLFVLGDNRRFSTDSRHFGFVDMDDVIGKVNLRYWPIGKFNWYD